VTLFTDTFTDTFELRHFQSYGNETSGFASPAGSWKSVASVRVNQPHAQKREHAHEVNPWPKLQIARGRRWEPASTTQAD
jgi:hypothetical protein